MNEKEYDINYKNVDRYSLKLEAFGHKDLEAWVKRFGGEYSDYDKKAFVHKLAKNLTLENIDKYLDEGFMLTNESLATLFMRATKKKNKEVISHLHHLSLGRDIEPRDSQLNTPLLSAVGSHGTSLEIVSWFLEKGYDPTVQNMFEENAFGFAARKKKEDTIIYLLENDYMKPFEPISVRGRLLDTDKTEGVTFEIKRYKNLYMTAKQEKLKKVQKYLEENYGY